MNIDKISIRTWMLVGFVLAAGFLLLSYSSVLSHYFWDEDDFIYVSTAIDEVYPTYIFSSEHYVQAFPRPVVHLYCWIIALFSGTVIWPYFLFNLFLYAASSVLLFRLVHRLSSNLPIGVLVGVFYLVSPCATDNLYWMAAGATGFLSGFLILLTANIYMKVRTDSSLRLWFLACFTAILAMGTKESALSLPLLLTLVEFARSGSKDGWWKRLLPFYILASLIALNVVLVQLSYSDDANFTRYGISWMILRNLLHFFIYPLVGAMPPNICEYTLIKMIVYPVLWTLPLFFGSKLAKKFVLLGSGWILLSSLPFLSWTMNFQGFLPKVCDIPSRYFNIPSMGAAMVACGLFIMLHERFRKVIVSSAAVLMIVAIVLSGVNWTHEEVQPIIQQAATERCLVDLVLSCWDGSEYLYIGSFGFRELRIESYNRMYFHGRLLQSDNFPANVPPGTRMLLGPKTSPGLFVYDGSTWRIERSYPSCERFIDTEDRQEMR